MMGCQWEVFVMSVSNNVEVQGTVATQSGVIMLPGTEPRITII